MANKAVEKRNVLFQIDRSTTFSVFPLEFNVKGKKEGNEQTNQGAFSILTTVSPCTKDQHTEKTLCHVNILSGHRIFMLSALVLFSVNTFNARTAEKA